jgi:hypothetical protein
MYLQSLDVATNFPMNLQHYRFCISCGLDNNEHPIDDVLQRTILRNGRLKGKFGSIRVYDPNVNQK